MNIFIANPFLDQETYQIITRNVTESKFREPGDNTRQLSDPMYFNTTGRSRDPSWLSQVMNIFIANPFLDQETYQIITRNVTESKFREPGDNTRQLSDPMYFNTTGRSRDPSWLSQVMNIFIANPFLDQETYQIITRNVTESKFREPGDNTRQLSDPMYFNTTGRSRDPSWLPQDSWTFL